jgi:hypothetical protein
MSAARRIALALAVVSATLAWADQGRTVTVYDGLATLWVPEGWHQIPPTVLDYFSIRTAEVTGGRVAETYQHGFRPGDPELELSLPQVLIQIREDGRLSYGQLMHLPTPEQVSDPAGGPLADHSGSLLRDVELTALSFDRERYCLRVDSVLDLAIEGRTIVRSASFLTERGVFTLHFYDLEESGQLSAALFERMVSSVGFDDQLAYRPRLADRWSSRITAALLFAAAAILVGAAVAARRRARPRPNR